MTVAVPKYGGQGSRAGEAVAAAHHALAKRDDRVPSYDDVRVRTQETPPTWWRRRLGVALADAILGLCYACHEPEADHPSPGACRSR